MRINLDLKQRFRTFYAVFGLGICAIFLGSFYSVCLAGRDAKGGTLLSWTYLIASNIEMQLIRVKSGIAHFAITKNRASILESSNSECKDSPVDIERTISVEPETSPNIGALNHLNGKCIAKGIDIRTRFSNLSAYECGVFIEGILQSPVAATKYFPQALILHPGVVDSAISVSASAESLLLSIPKMTPS